MLQVDICPFASDALEDAMRLAQTKSLNSFSFSDCINHLNYVWSDIYSQIACIDSGYYSKTVQITQKLTKLPKFVKNSVMVYAAPNPVGHDRILYRQSSNTDMTAPGTYSISGTDLWCPDAERRRIWFEYVPQPAQIFFTHHNRDPILSEYDANGNVTRHRNNRYGLFTLLGVYCTEDVSHATAVYEMPENPQPDEIVLWRARSNESYRRGYYYKYNAERILWESIMTEVQINDDTPVSDITMCTSWRLRHLNTSVYDDDDITTYLLEPGDSYDGKWNLCYISCAYPYIFVSYAHSLTGEHKSGFLDKSYDFTEYNPFDFTGKGSNVEYVSTDWNDKTGVGTTLLDYNDLYTVIVDGQATQLPRIKSLGWTPDTKLVYPAPEVYRYLVARLAEKFSTLNESSIMGVQSELLDARFAFNAFLKKDKSAWSRIRNANPATYGDYL